MGSLIIELKGVFRKSNDPLVQLNTINILAKSKEDWVRKYLIDVIFGYMLEERIITIIDSFAYGTKASEISKRIKSKFYQNVMRLHISESVEAISLFMDTEIINILE